MASKSPHSRLKEIEAALARGAPLPPPPPPPSPPAEAPAIRPQTSNPKAKALVADPSPSSWAADTLAPAHIKRDRDLSEDDYHRVYEAYATTGKVRELSHKTGLEPKQVEHLLNYGIARLGLPAIRQHAVNQHAVDARLTTAMAQIQQAHLEAKPNATFEQLEAAEAAATERATKEAAAAQILLDTGLKAGKMIGDYVAMLQGVIEDPEGGMVVPQKVGLDTLTTLTKALKEFSGAIDKAVSLSKETSGGAQSNDALNLANNAAKLVARMTRTETLEFAVGDSGLPRSLTGQTQQKFINAESKDVPGPQGEGVPPAGEEG